MAAADTAVADTAAGDGMVAGGMAVDGMVVDGTEVGGMEAGGMEAGGSGWEVIPTSTRTMRIRITGTPTVGIHTHTHTHIHTRTDTLQRRLQGGRRDTGSGRPLNQRKVKGRPSRPKGSNHRSHRRHLADAGSGCQPISARSPCGVVTVEKAEHRSGAPTVRCCGAFWPPTVAVPDRDCGHSVGCAPPPHEPKRFPLACVARRSEPHPVPVPKFRTRYRMRTATGGWRNQSNSRLHFEAVAWTPKSSESPLPAQRASGL